MGAFKYERRISDDELASPLLNKESNDTEVSSEYSVKNNGTITTKPTAEQTITALVVGAFVTTGAASSILCFIMYPAVIVYIAGGVCLMECGVVVYNQRKITVLPVLRDTVNMLRQQAELLDNAIDDMQKEIDDLKIIQDRFGGVEIEAQELAKKQGTSVDAMISLVEENEEILDLMRENLRQRILTDVIGSVMRTDQDNNDRFDRVEAKILALKIKIKLEVYGILFDEAKFLEAISLNPSLSGALAVVKKLLPREYQDNDMNDDRATRHSRALHFDDTESLDEDDIYDMFYMSREEQEMRESVMAVRAQFDGAPSSDRISLAKSYLKLGSRRLSTMVRSSGHSIQEKSN